MEKYRTLLTHLGTSNAPDIEWPVPSVDRD
ncbi:tail fiber assembly protein [Enterobacter asburiae]